MFGSSINGKAFPQTKSITGTIRLLESILKISVVNYEDDLASIEFKRDRNKVHNSYKEEYVKYNSGVIQTKEKQYQEKDIRVFY